MKLIKNLVCFFKGHNWVRIKQIENKYETSQEEEYRKKSKILKSIQRPFQTRLYCTRCKKER